MDYPAIIFKQSHKQKSISNYLIDLFPSFIEINRLPTYLSLLLYYRSSPQQHCTKAKSVVTSISLNRSNENLFSQITTKNY